MTENSRDTISYSKITFSSFFILLGTVLCYLYFLNMAVVEVVLRSDMSNRQQALHAEIATLESRYIDAQHTVAARITTLDGYTNDTEKFFVSRSESNLVFTAN